MKGDLMYAGHLEDASRSAGWSVIYHVSLVDPRVREFVKVKEIDQLSKGAQLEASSALRTLLGKSAIEHSAHRLRGSVPTVANVDDERIYIGRLIEAGMDIESVRSVLETTHAKAAVLVDMYWPAIVRFAAIVMADEYAVILQENEQASYVISCLVSNLYQAQRHGAAAALVATEVAGGKAQSLSETSDITFRRRSVVDSYGPLLGYFEASRAITTRREKIHELELIHPDAMNLQEFDEISTRYWSGMASVADLASVCFERERRVDREFGSLDSEIVHDVRKQAEARIIRSLAAEIAAFSTSDMHVPERVDKYHAVQELAIIGCTPEEIIGLLHSKRRDAKNLLDENWTIIEHLVVALEAGSHLNYEEIQRVMSGSALVLDHPSA
jgi:hypothetical protein